MENTTPGMILYVPKLQAYGLLAGFRVDADYLSHFVDLTLPAGIRGEQWQTKHFVSDLSITRLDNGVRSYLAPRHQPTSLSLIFLTTLTSRSTGIS